MPKDDAGRIYTCPYSKRDYRGTCPVTSCPASIKASRHDSGCLHNCFANKDEIGFQELSFALGKDVAYLKSRYDEGVSSLKNLLLFKRYLEWVRLQAGQHSFCAFCGSVLHSKSSCGKGCKKSPIMKRRLCKYPFNVEMLEVTKQDIGLLVHHHKDLTRLFKEDFFAVTRMTENDIKRLY